MRWSAGSSMNSDVVHATLKNGWSCLSQGQRRRRSVDDCNPEREFYGDKWLCVASQGSDHRNESNCIMYTLPCTETSDQCTTRDHFLVLLLYIYTLLNGSPICGRAAQKLLRGCRWIRLHRSMKRSQLTQTPLFPRYSRLQSKFGRFVLCSS